jgi:polyisoprenoid-binding protein YceI
VKSVALNDGTCCAGPEGVDRFVTDSIETARTGLAHFVVDARVSRFTVQAIATGLLSAMGHNPTIGIRKFTGEVDFSSEPLEGRGLRFSIDAASLSVQDDISDKDRREMERLMNEQVLQIKKYPEILYEASIVSVTRVGDSMYSAALNGSLSLHGVNRKQPVTAQVSIFGDMLRASGGFILKQSDYQIKPVVVAGGALKLKDELRLSFEIVARAMTSL